MNLWKTKPWPILELGIFKWTNILFGAVMGAYFSDFVMRYIWVFVALVVLGSARVIFFYFRHPASR